MSQGTMFSHCILIVLLKISYKKKAVEATKQEKERKEEKT
jgi:hypothetical protein